MNRKNFIKASFLSGLAALSGKLTSQTPVKEEPIVGFNHLPVKQEKTMKTVLHRAATRGHANHGWLDSHHTFSFANYYNPERMNFGVLRVLNDDIVQADRGFGRHPHDNMEIISIPLEGQLEHQDSMGTVSIIRKGEIQVMSAGTGVTHSEMNRTDNGPVKFLQIWVHPRERNVAPRYDQISLQDVETKNAFYQVLSPNADDQGVWIHQDAWFHLGKFDAQASTRYDRKQEGNGMYVFVLEGTAVVNGETLNKRDGMGLWDTDGFDFKAESDAQILVMEVPMQQ